MRVRLGILKEYLSCVLVEGRVDDAREKFPDMEEEDFDYLVANQPAGSNNKYLMWSCAQAETMLQDDPDRQALALVIQAVRLFDGNQQRLKQRDINQYKTVGDVEAAVAEVGKSKGQKAKEVRADTDVVYQDDRFLVLRPHTTEASCKYGVGTKWCIAATSGHNYYNSYSTSNNKFYFVIDKKAEAGTPNSKFAFAIVDMTGDRQIQVYDAADKRVDPSVVAKHVGEHWPAIWEKIQGHVKANPTTREVEDAQKAVEEHIKALLKGEKVSEKGLEKIAHDGKLTTPVVKALIKSFENYQRPDNYSDARQSIISSLAGRVGQMPNEAAMAVITWTISTKPEDPQRYWSGSYNLERMIKEANLSAEDFKEIAKTADESTLSKIFVNPNAPEDLKDQIAKQVKDFRDKEAQRDVYWKLIESGKITEEQFRTAMEKQSYLASSILSSAERIKLSANLIRLIPVKDADDLKRILKMPNMPTDYAADLIDARWKTLDKYDLYDVLKTTHLAVEKVEQLWKDKGQDIRTALLQNPSIGPNNLSTFAKSKNSAYRFAVAHNTATKAEDLALLATDDSVSTRAAVGANPNTSGETLTTLAGDEATAVRAGVASNAAAPRRVLDALKKDSDDFVRKAVRKTLKSLEATETYVRMLTSMSYLLQEEITDEDTQDIMTPGWSEIPIHAVTTQEFIAVFMLQNNGSASREEIEAAFQRWNPQHATTRTTGGYRRHGRRRYYGGPRREVNVPAKNVWQILKDSEKYGSTPSRTTSAGGRGWWWSPPGINKGSLLRLTPAGAAAAMEVLSKLQRGGRQWGPAGQMPPAKKSPPPKELDPNRANEPAAPRGPKTTYKIYGRFKGHPAATRLKGQAYVAPADTEFRGGEQAYITPEDGKLKVKKVDSDHTQTWDPTEG